MEEEKIYREKVFRAGAISIGVCLLIAYWYTTQGLAADCGYSKLLGVCLSIGDVHIYPPYKFYVWQRNEALQRAIPEIIRSYAAYPYLGFLIGAGFAYACARNMKVETSHGSVAFATVKEIDETGLGMYEDKLVTEERELFGIKYKKKVRRVVMKFAPLVGDGSSTRWNLLAEINFRTVEEISDVAMIVGIMVNSDGEKAGGSGDSAFWDKFSGGIDNGRDNAFAL